MLVSSVAGAPLGDGRRPERRGSRRAATVEPLAVVADPASAQGAVHAMITMPTQLESSATSASAAAAPSVTASYGSA